MKLSGARIVGFLKAPDPSIRAILVYGPDQGLIRERMNHLIRTVLDDPSDPFRLSELPPALLREEPGRLKDEAAALSFTGGRRVVVVRDAADTLSTAFQSFLETPVGDALVLVEGDDLSARSSLRKLFEASNIAAALPCYADEGADLEAVIRESLASHQLTASPDVSSWLAAHLGSDRALTRSEIEKLALYMGKPGPVTLEDVQACVGDTAALSLDDMINATAEGDHAIAQRTLSRLFSEGTAPIACLRGLLRHFTRLHLAAGLMAQGKSVEQALSSLKPPPFFKVSSRMKRQLSLWSPSALGSALDLLGTTEADCKTTGSPVSELCSRAVLQLARAASRNQSRASRR